MLERFLAEPDILCRVAFYLCLPTVSRLFRSSRALHKFHQKNRRQIRSQQNVEIIFHFYQASFVLATSNQSTRRIEIEVEYFDDKNESQYDRCCALSPEIAFYSDSGAFLLRISREYFISLDPIWDYFLCGFRFDQLSIDMAFISGIYFQLTYWLTNQKSSIDRLRFDDACPDEDSLISFIDSLQATDVKLANRKQSLKILSKSFFHKLPKLRKLDAHDVDCAVTDEDLNHFDLLRLNNGGAPLITIEGLYSWIERKMREGSLGDSYQSRMPAFFEALTQQLDVNYYQLYDCFSGPYQHTVRLKRDPKEERMELIVHHLYHLKNTLKDSDLSIDISIEMPETSWRFKMQTKSNIDALRVMIKGQKFNTQAALIVDHILPNIPVYKFGNMTYAICFDDAEQLRAVLTWLGTKLKGMQFDQIIEENSSLIDESLKHLLTIFTNSNVPASSLHFSNSERVSGKLLAEVISLLKAEELVCGNLSLPGGFFKSSPTLKSITCNGEVSHDIRVTNERLLRLNVFDAKCAQTRITLAGLRRWIDVKLARGHVDKCLIRLPLERRDQKELIFKQLTENMKGYAEKIDVMTKKFTFTSDGKQCIELLFENEVLLLRGYMLSFLYNKFIIGL